MVKRRTKSSQAADHQEAYDRVKALTLRNGGGTQVDFLLCADLNCHYEVWGGAQAFGEAGRNGEAEPTIDSMQENALTSLLPSRTVIWEHYNGSTCSTMDLLLATGSLTPPFLPRTTPPPVTIRITRSSQNTLTTRSSAPTDRSASQIERVTAEERPQQPKDAEVDSNNESQTHFSTNINLGCQKADAYYIKPDASLVYRAAVVVPLHLKWRGSDRYWASKPVWREEAKKAVEGLWKQYKHRPTPIHEHTDLASSTVIRDKWSPSDEPSASTDQFKAYIDEPWVQVHPSPIPYWISRLTVVHNSQKWLSTFIQHQHAAMNQSVYSVKAEHY
ncbi:hypothetical protein MBLNU13_g09744t1 [Cladosporium sp. NU13]